MSDYVSPYVSAAAARANYRAPLEMPLSVPHTQVCPCCGKTPALEPDHFGQVCIYCSTDDCDLLGEFQAMGYTVRDAADLWNMRCDTYLAGSGGLK